MDLNCMEKLNLGVRLVSACSTFPKIFIQASINIKHNIKVKIKIIIKVNLNDIKGKINNKEDKIVSE